MTVARYCRRTLTLAAWAVVLAVSLFGSSGRVHAQGTEPAPAANTAPTQQSPDAASAAAILTGGYGAPTPPFSAAGGGGGEMKGALSAGMLFEQLGGDYFITLDLYNTLSFGPISFGLWVPLRLRVIDNDPQNDGVFRKEDWDEISDFTRLLRFVEVNLGGKNWRFRGRFGALDGESLGHGTALAGYNNNIDRDHYQGGLALSTAIRYGGIELMLDNLIAPEIFGLRLHLRPASFFTDNPWLNKLAVGFSLAMDAHAPTGIAWSDPDGDGRYNAELDSKQNYRVVDHEVVAIYGIDLEYELIRSALIDLVPYVDLNFLSARGSGTGLHVGFFFNIRLPVPLLHPTLLTRMEYRFVGAGYAPRYIDALYETQRLVYAPDLVDPTRNNAPRSKSGWLTLGDTGRSGWLGELFFDLGGWIRVGGSYEDYSGPDNAALTLSLILPKFSIAQAGAYYTRRGFDSFSEAFELDGALATAFVRFKAYGPLYFTAAYTRSWHVDPADPSSYSTDDNWSVGLSASFNY